jgi:hypothetical protein
MPTVPVTGESETGGYKVQASLSNLVIPCFKIKELGVQNPAPPKKNKKRTSLTMWINLKQYLLGA